MSQVIPTVLKEVKKCFSPLFLYVNGYIRIWNSNCELWTCGGSIGSIGLW